MIADVDITDSGGSNLIVEFYSSGLDEFILLPLLRAKGVAE